MAEKIKDLVSEDVSSEITVGCNLCQESSLPVGAKTKYGSVITYRIGSTTNGWFATLSPKTGSDPQHDFTIQLMSNKHLTHFCQIDNDEGCAENYGVAFAKLSRAVTAIMASESKDFKTAADTRESSISLATYGKCTNWKEKKEHLHIKLFPFRGAIGQPYTVDSTFEKKQIHKDKDGEFVKMLPVKKVMIDNDRFNYLAEKLISLLSEEQ